MAYKIKSTKRKENFNPATVPVYYLEGDYGLTPEQEIEVWQYNVDNGMVWQLQGWYGRTAQGMLDAGILSYPKTRKHDYYGNPVPTQEEISSGKVKRKQVFG